MKTALTYLKPFAVICFIAGLVLMSSCKKEEDPAYVGTWGNSYTLEDSTGTYNEKLLLVFTKSNFSIFLQEKNPNTNQYVNFFGFKGSLSVSGGSMNFNMKSAGSTTIDSFSGLPTGIITYYDDPNQSFNYILYVLGISKTFSGTYSINGNKLTLSNVNGDGDFLDGGVQVEYIKE